MNFFRGWKPHPTIMAKNKIEAIPFENACVTKWKESNYGKGGIRYHDKNLALTFCGAIDDVWINEDDALIIVEYKTTSTSLGETIEKNPWYKNFKRQISFYAWLFKMNGYKVHNNGYFVYCNGHKESKSFLSFNNCLEFEVTCSPCTIDYSDVEEIIKHASDCLKHPNAPKSSINCMFCKYHEKLQNSNYHNNLTIKEHQGYKTKIVNKIYYKDENVT
ncbi:MAG: PD-(D/E)XK nuclease family protein [Candidatus Babeliales bacterium]